MARASLPNPASTDGVVRGPPLRRQGGRRTRARRRTALQETQHQQRRPPTVPDRGRPGPRPSHPRLHGHRTYRRDMNRCRCTCYHRIGCVKRVFCEVHINRDNIFICSSYSSSDLAGARLRGAFAPRGGPRGTPARVKAAYKRSSSQLDSGTRPTETHDRRRQELEPCPRRQSTKIQAGPGALCLLRAGCLGADPSRASLVPCAAPH